MSKLRKVRRLTQDEYLAEEELSDVRHEYVDGQVFAMSGANERHNRIAGNVYFRLRAAARGGRCGVFISDMRLQVQQRRIYYYPDVMLTCDDLLIRSNDADVEYYCRNAAGEWETARLEGDDLLGIDCGAYSTSLGLIDIYEDVVFPD